MGETIKKQPGVQFIKKEKDSNTDEKLKIIENSIKQLKDQNDSQIKNITD